MYTPRTWVLCVNQAKAKLYRLDVSLSAIERIVELEKDGADFAATLAAEVEYACGAGSTEQIILCGEFRLVNQVCQRVADDIRGRIAGIINQDLVDEKPEQIRLLAQPAAAKRCAA